MLLQTVSRVDFIHKFLTNTATVALVSAFVLSIIDYCSSLLFDSTHDVTSDLQLILNYAARAILSIPKSRNKSTYLKSFYWFTVNVRSSYKIACLCYHFHTTTMHHYMSLIYCRKGYHTSTTLYFTRNASFP